MEEEKEEEREGEEEETRRGEGGSNRPCKNVCDFKIKLEREMNFGKAENASMTICCELGSQLCSQGLREVDL